MFIHSLSKSIRNMFKIPTECQYIRLIDWHRGKKAKPTFNLRHTSRCHTGKRCFTNNLTDLFYLKNKINSIIKGF